MILTFVKMMRNAVTDLRMENVWQTYGRGMARFSAIKVNGSLGLTRSLNLEFLKKVNDSNHALVLQKCGN